MMPYVTQHYAPLSIVMAGIIADLPRYVRDNSTSEMIRVSRRNAIPKESIELQGKMLDMIRAGNKVTTADMVREFGKSRCSTYKFAARMVENGLIRLVKVNRKYAYWEAV